MPPRTPVRGLVARTGGRLSSGPLPFSPGVSDALPTVCVRGVRAARSVPAVPGHAAAAAERDDSAAAATGGVGRAAAAAGLLAVGRAGADSHGAYCDRGRTLGGGYVLAHLRRPHRPPVRRAV